MLATPMQPDEAAPEEPQAEPAAAEPEPEAPAEPVTEIIHQGQRIPLTAEQQREFAQKGYDYTRKTQILAEIKRDMDAKLGTAQQRLTELETFFSNPQNVIEYAEYIRAQTGQPSQPGSPDTIPTVHDVQQALKAQAAQLEQRLTNQISQARVQADEARQMATYDAELSSHVSGLVKKFAVLDAYDPKDLETSLRTEVGQQVQFLLQANPYEEIDLPKVKTMITQAAQRRAERVNSKLTNNLKMETVRAAKVRSSSIEPPGGQLPAAPAAVPNLKLGSRELRQSVIEEIEAAMRAGNQG